MKFETTFKKGKSNKKFNKKFKHELRKGNSKRSCWKRRFRTTLENHIETGSNQNLKWACLEGYLKRMCRRELEKDIELERWKSELKREIEKGTLQQYL